MKPIGKQSNRVHSKRKQKQTSNHLYSENLPLPLLTGPSDYFVWRKAQISSNNIGNEFLKAKNLLITLRNSDDIVRCKGIYNFNELMCILKTKYERPHLFVPKLLDTLKELPTPYNNNIMLKNIGVILNVYSQLESASTAAVKFFNSSVMEQCLSKLTLRDYQLLLLNLLRAFKMPKLPYFLHGQIVGVFVVM